MKFKLFALTIICMVLLVGSVSAFEFDNKLTYYNEDLKVELTNWFGLGVDYGTAKLKSHKSVNEVRSVVIGKDIVVMYYDFDFLELYEEGLGKVYFTDERIGEEIEKDYSFVYWTNETYEKDIYEEQCSKSLNGTNICGQVVVGKENVTREVWKPYNSRDIQKGKIRIGLQTDVKLDDLIDGVWTIGGKRIERHAVWTADLNVRLFTYYKLDENATNTFVLDSILNNNGTASTNTNNLHDASGVINSSFNFNGINEYFTSSINEDLSKNQHTINIWAKFDAFTDNYVIWEQGSGSTNRVLLYFDDVASGGEDWIRVYVDGNVGTIHYLITDSNWHMYTVVFDNDVLELYADGNSMGTQAFTSITRSADTFSVGRRPVSTFEYMSGNMDEMGIWNRSLNFSEITQLYNDGDGITYTNLFPPNVNLNSPIDFFNTSNPIINFNGTISDFTPDDVTIYIDDVGNETNSSGILGNYLFTKILSEGIHNWTYESCNSDGCNNGTARTLTIDTTSPTINLTSPNETIDFHKINTNLSVNWTVNDSSLVDICILEYEGVNRTVTCLDNQTQINITNSVNKTIIFYANDTLGNMNSSSRTWDYLLFLNSETYDTSIFGGLPTTFSANFLTNGSDITIANLSYNSTENLGTISNHGSNNFTVIKTITTTAVSEDINISFFWNITQGSFNNNVATKNQTILVLDIDDCSTNTHVLYNFTIVDEENQTILSPSFQNTSANINLQIYGFATTILVGEFNKSYSEINPFAVCLNNSLSSEDSFSHDIQIQYVADGYAPELYYIQNKTINSSTLNTNITLYDLNESDSQIFKIIFRDSSFLPVENALIEIKRRYVDESVFKIVEIPKTDEKGETIAHLVINNVIYTLQVIKFGVILATFNNVLADCQTPLVQSCEIDLNAFSESLVLPNFEETEDFNFTLGYDNDTRIVSSIFSIPSGEVLSISLNVTREDSLGVAVCTDILTSSSGTLSCTVPVSFGNSTIVAKIYRSGNLQAQGQIKLNQNPSDIYGVTLTGLGIFIMMTLIGVSISNNPVFTTIFLMVGIGLLFALNLVANNGFIGATATILWMVIALILILIKGAKRN